MCDRSEVKGHGPVGVLKAEEDLKVKDEYLEPTGGTEAISCIALLSAVHDHLIKICKTDIQEIITSLHFIYSFFLMALVLVLLASPF